MQLSPLYCEKEKGENAFKAKGDNCNNIGVSVYYMQSWKELLKWWGFLIYFFITCNKNLSVALLYIGYRETSGMNVWEARILIQHTSQ